jgi:hypothetical protein
MPAAIFTTTNPVSVGQTTKKSQFDKVFENTKAIKQGDVACDLERLALAALPATAGSNEVVVAGDATTKQLLVSVDGGKFRPIGDASCDPLFVALCY